ncbi:hypothetical protein WJU23_18820 [Prosthecobacter sp. SYSU 5D2]|uniref:hypothetical protein n=1 Tax=Prosthecobacter sp. SYSU 5D2 TaxID=3134134 RepID=UPI0031FEC48A
MLVVLQLRLMLSSLQRNLEELLEAIDGPAEAMVTASALSQARAKLRHTAFIELNELCVREFYGERLQAAEVPRAANQPHARTGGGVSSSARVVGAGAGTPAGQNVAGTKQLLRTSAMSGETGSFQSAQAARQTHATHRV